MERGERDRWLIAMNDGWAGAYNSRDEAARTRSVSVANTGRPALRATAVKQVARAIGG